MQDSVRNLKAQKLLGLPSQRDHAASSLQVRTVLRIENRLSEMNFL